MPVLTHFIHANEMAAPSWFICRNKCCGPLQYWEEN